MKNSSPGSVHPSWGIAVVVAGGMMLLYALGPRAGLPCPIQRFTGWYCPGCGMTRAIHALLKGEPGLAFLYNPLGMLALPVLAGGWLLWRLDSDCRCRWPEFRCGLIAFALVVVLIGYGILRNLPGWPIQMPDHLP